MENNKIQNIEESVSNALKAIIYIIESKFIKSKLLYLSLNFANNSGKNYEKDYQQLVLPTSPYLPGLILVIVNNSLRPYQVNYIPTVKKRIAIYNYRVMKYDRFIKRYEKHNDFLNTFGIVAVLADETVYSKVHGIIGKYNIHVLKICEVSIEGLCNSINSVLYKPGKRNVNICVGNTTNIIANYDNIIQNTLTTIAEVSAVNEKLNLTLDNCLYHIKGLNSVNILKL